MTYGWCYHSDNGSWLCRTTTSLPKSTTATIPSPPCSTIARDLTASLAAADRYARLLAGVRRAHPLRRRLPAAARGDASWCRSPATGSCRERSRGASTGASTRGSTSSCARASPVRFPPDSPLADPFDGLLAGDPHALEHIHACLGCALTEGGEVVGALTADALEPHAFDAPRPALPRDARRARRRRAAHDGAHRGARAAGRAPRAASRASCSARRAVERAARSSARARRSRGCVEEIALVAALGPRGARHRRDRRRQGAASRTTSTTRLARARRGADPRQLRGAAGVDRRERAVRPRRRARSPAPRATAPASSRSPTAARCSSTRSASCRSTLQPKLLRALQQGEIQRVGSRPRAPRRRARDRGDQPRPRRARSSAGRFRADLYHRLAVFPLPRAAAARAARGHPAARRALRRRGAAPARPRAACGSRRGRAHALAAADWPGNVRELENVVSRAVLRAAARPRPASAAIRSTRAHLDLGAASDGDAGAARGRGRARRATAAPARCASASSDFERRADPRGRRAATAATGPRPRATLGAAPQQPAPPRRPARAARARVAQRTGTAAARGWQRGQKYVERAAAPCTTRTTGVPQRGRAVRRGGRRAAPPARAPRSCGARPGRDSLHQPACHADEAVELAVAQGRHGVERRDAADEQDLGLVHVADPGEHGLVEQRLADRRLAARAQPRPDRCGVEPAAKRSGPSRASAGWRASSRAESSSATAAPRHTAATHRPRCTRTPTRPPAAAPPRTPSGRAGPGGCAATAPPSNPTSRCLPRDWTLATAAAHDREPLGGRGEAQVPPTRSESRCGRRARPPGARAARRIVSPSGMPRLLGRLLFRSALPATGRRGSPRRPSRNPGPERANPASARNGASGEAASGEASGAPAERGAVRRLAPLAQRSALAARGTRASGLVLRQQNGQLTAAPREEGRHGAVHEHHVAAGRALRTQRLRLRPGERGAVRVGGVGRGEHHGGRLLGIGLAAARRRSRAPGSANCSPPSPATK